MTRSWTSHFWILVPPTLVFMAGGAGWTQVAESSDVSGIAASTMTRIATVSVSEPLINELLKQYVHNNNLRDLAIRLNPDKGQLEASGFYKVPTDELKAINYDPALADFGFQLAIKLKTTRQGHLILIFPLDQTYFYPTTSQDPDRDRIVIPNALISLALSLAQGYIATLSGDFSGFDRKAAMLEKQVAQIDQQLAAATDPGERDDLESDRNSAENQLASIPLERKQAQKAARHMNGMIGFVGEHEFERNEALSVRHNALVLRLKMDQLAPYLKGMQSVADGC